MQIAAAFLAVTCVLFCQVTDLHRHFIDGLTIPSPSGGEPLRRVDEVFDCWFESGSMPYAQLHYPFENADFFKASFPADFVAEGQSQCQCLCSECAVNALVNNNHLSNKGMPAVLNGNASSRVPFLWHMYSKCHTLPMSEAIL